MLKSVKVRLYPNKSQTNIFANLFGCNRLIYNKCLTLKELLYSEYNTNINLSDLGDYFHNYLLKSNEYHYLLSHNTKVLKQSIINLLTGYSNYFNSIKGNRKGERINKPIFKKKFDKQSVRFPLEAISKKCLSDNNVLNLTKTVNNLKYKCSESDKKYLLKYKENIKSITVSMNKAGEYYASILIDGSVKNEFRKNVINDIANNDYYAMDIGIKTYIVGYNGDEFNKVDNPKFLYKKEIKIKKLQKKLSKLDIKNKKNKDSEKIVVTNNRNKLKKRIAKVYNKIRKQKDDFLNVLSSKIVNDNQVIIIEDLNVKGMLKNHKLAKAIQQINIGEFVNKIEYKANWYGREVIKVNRFYPSSKLCSNCGLKNKELKLSDREWVCDGCGVNHDRDENAGLNLYLEGKRIYEEIGRRNPEYKLEDSPLMDDKTSNGMLKSKVRKIQEDIIENNLNIIQ